MIKQLNSMPFISICQKGFINKDGMGAPSTTVIKQTIPLDAIHRYIVSERARQATLDLRATTDEKLQKMKKALNFYSCTPNGTFTYRHQKNLIEESGMMVIDFDHLAPEKLAELLRLLPHDRRYETELMFTSPRGNGIKWFIACGERGEKDFGRHFDDISDYIAFEYGVRPDPSGKDIARCCYLSWDPDCYINPRFFNHFN